MIAKMIVPFATVKFIQLIKIICKMTILISMVRMT